MQHIEVRTRSRQEFVDITVPVEAAVEQSAVKEGICVLWSTHTTAGLTVNENADPDVVRDMTTWFTQHIPRDPAYRHLEGNSDSHIMTTLVGPGLTLIVSKGRLQLGRWQGIYFCEFDGPRTRTVLAKVIAGE
jgi:secondary thiamine-phosphate synthase enzyme